MTAPVFMVDDSTLSCALASVKPGMTVVLSGPEARHAVTVRRLRESERVDLADGAGTRIVGVVGAMQRGVKDELPVIVERVQTEEDSVAILTLIQALAKGGRDEQAVETSTEVGVHQVIPWQAARSISQWNGNKVAKGQARWQAIAREAAKQARRSVIPEVLEPKNTRQLCIWIREQIQQGAYVALLHEEATTSISQFLSSQKEQPHSTDDLSYVASPDGGSVSASNAGEEPTAVEVQHRSLGNATSSKALSVAVIVGPEGGIGEEETRALIEAGAIMVRLGPHVMRTSSAGSIALAVLAQRAGLWEIENSEY
ncbi:16S rRNA (uracil(1498)-N(3))-methyltransferase [Actinomyces vulturis]|uniref:16S rRNA (uracil(1498)-N(3))-methyltransferase n=1 Tax=Actinomyces vulturis TaxID=1857645 RepID=UPI000831C576|nr:16S rRNA (uracil(1498)-N(3))-methyltransferase [Actinomyces vulturis]